MAEGTTTTPTCLARSSPHAPKHCAPSQEQKGRRTDHDQADLASLQSLADFVDPSHHTGPHARWGGLLRRSTHCLRHGAPSVVRRCICSCRHGCGCTGKVVPVAATSTRLWCSDPSPFARTGISSLHYRQPTRRFHQHGSDLRLYSIWHHWPKGVTRQRKTAPSVSMH